MIGPLDVVKAVFRMAYAYRPMRMLFRLVDLLVAVLARGRRVVLHIIDKLVSVSTHR